MLGRAIASQALGHGGPRELASEHGGPRAAGVRADFMGRADSGQRTVQVEVDERTARALRP